MKPKAKNTMMSMRTLSLLFVLIFGTIVALQGYAQEPQDQVETLASLSVPSTTPSIEQTPVPANSADRLAFLKGKLKQNLSEIPLPDLMMNFSSIEAFNLTRDEDGLDTVWYFQELRKLLSESEWVNLLERFHNNIFPLEDVIDSLPPAVQQPARDCGAKYVQVVMSKIVMPPIKTANVFCFYIAPSTSVFEQGAIDALTPDGMYDHTTFWPALYQSTATASHPFELVRFGMPQDEMAPAPYPFIGDEIDRRAVLKSRNAPREEAADIFSTMSSTEVTSEMVTWLPWGPNEDFLFMVEVDGIYYYTEPYYNVYEYTFFHQFGEYACEEFKIFTPGVKDHWIVTKACYSTEPISTASRALRR